MLLSLQIVTKIALFCTIRNGIVMLLAIDATEETSSALTYGTTIPLTEHRCFTLDKSCSCLSRDSATGRS